MKKTLFAFLLGCMVVFTGCIDIIEELFLNKDGSGQYKITMDMSALAADGGMKSMMEGMMQADSTSESPSMQMEQDTIMYMKDAPDSVRQRFVHPELMDRMSMHILVSETKEKMLFSFNFDFKNVGEINDFLEDLDKMQESNNMSSAMGGGGGLMPSASRGQKLFQMSKRMIKRFPAPEPDESLNSDDMAMAKMMFSGATYKTIYHLPGKVKKVSNKKAIVDSKTVTIETPMEDVLDGKGMLETEIKFKKR